MAEAVAQPLGHGLDHRSVGRFPGPRLGHSSAATLNARTELGAVADPPTSECCVPAPPVLEFDQAGNLVGHWGGPGDGFDWPESNHGVTVDHMDNVWIGANGGEDSHLLKFSRDGTFLLQVGRPGQGVDSNSTEHFSQVAKIFVDPNSNEAYVADGYGNRRVAVLDGDTGEFKRYWGAYGNRPDDTDLGLYDPNAPPAQQFRNPVHCAMTTNDGLVYVCDRQGDRIQVFRTDGTFVDEVIVAQQTLGSGSAWDLAFSSDPGQSYIYLADGTNAKVYIIQRDTLEVLNELRRRRAPARAVPRRAQHCHRFAGQHFHDRDLRGEAPAKVRVQGGWDRCRPDMRAFGARVHCGRPPTGKRLLVPVVPVRSRDCARTGRGFWFCLTKSSAGTAGSRLTTDRMVPATRLPIRHFPGTWCPGGAWHLGYDITHRLTGSLVVGKRLFSRRRMSFPQ